MATEFPTVNGNYVSWSDIGISIGITGGSIVETADITDVSFEDGSELTEVFGLGVRKLGRTVGKAKKTAGMTMLLPGWIALRNALKTKAIARGNQKVIGLVEFDILISWTPTGDDSATIETRKIKSCRVLGTKESASQGTDAAKVEITLDCMDVATIDADGDEVVIL